MGGGGYQNGQKVTFLKGPKIGSKITFLIFFLDEGVLGTDKRSYAELAP
jgi:hypothetical protein